MGHTSGSPDDLFSSQAGNPASNRGCERIQPDDPQNDGVARRCELAATAGLEVPAPDPQAAKKAEQAATLHDVMAAAQDWFVEQLLGIEGAEARAYLKKRGITPATLKTFGFGYSPDARGRLKLA